MWRNSTCDVFELNSVSDLKKLLHDTSHDSCSIKIDHFLTSYACSLAVNRAFLEMFSMFMSIPWIFDWRRWIMVQVGSMQFMQTFNHQWAFPFRWLHHWHTSLEWTKLLSPSWAIIFSVWNLALFSFLYTRIVLLLEARPFGDSSELAWHVCECILLKLLRSEAK